MRCIGNPIPGRAETPDTGIARGHSEQGKNWRATNDDAQRHIDAIALQAEPRAKGADANRAAGDAFAANVLPIIKQAQASGAKG